MNDNNEMMTLEPSVWGTVRVRLSHASELIRGRACVADARVRTFFAQPDEGAATAEYAVVLVAATGFGAVLVALLKSGAVKELLKALITKALKMA
ncbi:Protein of unknown function [Bifidobacterium bohemicum]|uniref:DUF4244 domain-containing protein n=1 Tax=Bifidobacterium bohemicum DSM 22767 TaxID=1437606 RepID=A0A086ZE48_9BIFI|nr:DUF4244 domain-containing protein [Bifidobacterium bohemicum]KFI44798.1 hypothetical protein BBOH_1526 [Bifidobacterium bohemicum DSM 22767]SCB94086.1 Protein of unknown function [Bifidobacterium bohemicum]